MRTTLYHIIIYIALPMALLAGCTAHTDDSYSSELCNELAVKVERRDSLSQDDYRAMIGQNEAILRYLIEKSKEIADSPDEERNAEWRRLLAEPEYMERFSNLFTIGSTLYQADAEGRLDSSNKKLYHNLDRYNKELADYSDAN